MFILSIASFTLITIYGNNLYRVVEAINVGTTKLHNKQLNWTIIRVFPLDLIFLLVIIGWFIYSMVRGWKNDNVRYHFKYLIPLVFIIILLVIRCCCFNGGLSFQTSDIQQLFETTWNTHLAVKLITTPIDTSEAAKSYYNSLAIGYFVISIIVFVVIIAAFVVVVSVIFVNPKRDDERIAALLRAN